MSSAARPQRAQALQDDGVAGDGKQDEQAEKRVAPELADLQPEQALLEDADHHGAEQGADHGSRAAENVDAADHDGRDDLAVQVRAPPRP